MPPDPLNPFAGVADPFGDPFAQRRQPALIQPLQPAEQESILSRIGHGALGGLGWLGETLDKTFGGRTVRGLLGGQGVDAFKHLIPLSDTLGITDPSQAVSGKELLGYDKHDDSWGGFLGGLGAEMLLDPATYLSFGSKALTGVGQAAKKAGVLPRGYAAKYAGLVAGTPEAEATARKLFDVAQGPISAAQAAQVADKPLGYTAKLSVPFMEHLGEVGLSGERGARVADTIGEFARYNPVTRTLAPHFDASLSKLGPAGFSEEAQRSTRASVEEMTKAQAEVLKEHFARVKQLEDAGFLDEAKSLRQQMENQYRGAVTPGAMAGATVAASTRSQKAAQFAEKQALGIRTGENVSQFGVEYMHRQATRDAEEAFAKAGDKNLLQPKSADMKKRIAELDIPGGTEKLNELLADPSAVARGTPAQKKAAHDYARAAIGYDEAEHARLNSLNGGAGPTPTIPNPAIPGTQMPNPDFQKAQELATLRKHGQAVAELAGNLPDEFRTANQGKGLRFFGNHPLADVATYNLEHVKQTAAAKNWYDTAAAGTLAAPVKNAPTLWDVLKDKGVMYKTTKDATGAYQGKLPQVIDRLEQAGLVPPGLMAGKPKDIKAALQNLWVKPDVAADLLRSDQTLKVPYSLKPVLGATDYMTNLTKTGQTVLWPAFHARNFMSGLWQNLVGGAGHGAGGLDLLSPLREAQALRQGGVLPWANTIKGFEHLSPEEATRSLLENAYAHGARIPAERSLANELLGNRPQESLPGVIGTFGGRQEKTLGQSLKEGVGLAADPTNQATGRLGRWNPLDYTNFAPAKAGREVSHLSDDVNRLAGYLGFVKQGYEPSVASDMVKGLHWSGGTQGGMAPFEREVMRRLVPFYCVPEHAQILTRDGWKTCDQLVIGEEVMTYNQGKDCLEWQTCENKAIFDHDQELLTFKSKKKTFSFTPEHRWPVRKIAQTTKRPYGTYIYPETSKTVVGRELKSHHAFVQTAGFFGTDESVLTPDEARLLGWIMTDGYFRWRGNHLEAVLFQHPKKFFAEVCRVAGGKPRKPHPDNGTVTVPILQERLVPLRRILDPKKTIKDNLVKIVTRLSRPAAEAMYDAMYKADGNCKNRERAGEHLGKEHPGIRAAERILAFMLGKTTTESNKGCYMSSRRYLKVASGKIVSEHYTGRVWCPRTANGTWVMKQNGVILITGNSWSRANIPFQAQQLLERPGGMTAQAARATGELRQQDGIMPDWIGEGPAIPIGAREGNTQRYLSSFGLPFEDLNRVLSTGPNAVRRTMQQLLGDMNPLLKGPLEYATGLQFYSGRQMDDLYSRTGNPVLDQLVMNSPLSRALTMASMAADPRKGLTGFATNFVSPFRVTDVDMQRAQDIQARRLVEQELQGNPNVRQFTNFYLTPQQAQAVDPRTLETLRMYRTLVDQAKARSQGQAQPVNFPMR